MRHLLTALLLALSTLCFAENINTLRVVPLQGQPVLFHVGGKPEMTVNGHTVTITGADHDTPFSLEISEIDHVDFVYEKQDGIAGVTAESIRISRVGRTLTFSSLPEEAQFTLYSLDGKTLRSERASRTFTLDLSSLPSSVYIIRIDNFTFKISI